MKRAALACLAISAILASSSCSSDRAQRRPYLIQENLDYAAAHMARGEKEEAAQLYQAVLLANPLDKTAQAGLEQIGDCSELFLRPSLLGINKCRGIHDDSVWLRVLMYPVNRALDVLDVASAHVGLEGGLYVDAHATRALQAAGGAGGGMQLGWWQKRDLAIGSGHVAGAALGPFSVEGEGNSRLGVRGARGESSGIVGLNRPSDMIYQTSRDYWGVGARVTALLLGVEVEFHPVELADAVAGVFFLDFLEDDIGHKKGLSLPRHEVEAMSDLLATLSPSELRTRMRGRAIETSPLPTSETVTEPEIAQSTAGPIVAP